MGVKMTKKDYILLAKVIKETLENNPEYYRITLHHLVNNLATEFNQDNPMFNKSKFHQAIFGG